MNFLKYYFACIELRCRIFIKQSIFSILVKNGYTAYIDFKIMLHFLHSAILHLYINVTKKIIRFYAICYYRRKQIFYFVLRILLPVGMLFYGRSVFEWLIEFIKVFFFQTLIFLDRLFEILFDY